MISAETLLIVLIMETLIALLIIAILYIRVKQLTKDLTDLKRKLQEGK